MEPKPSRLTPLSVTWAGVIVDLLLGGGKITAGIVFHSQAILADGIHSLSDLITDAAVLLGLRVSGRPADEDHHFGHYRVSTLVALFVGAALLVAAGFIAYEAVTNLRQKHDEVVATIPFLAALVSMVSKEVLYRVTRTVGLRAGDPSVVANAWHHRTDAFSSVAVATGLGAVVLFGPQWAFLDHVMALVLSLLLAGVGIKTIRGAAAELVDKAPDKETLATIHDAISTTEGVLGYHAVRARQVGGRVSMDVHVQVPPDLTVKQGHDIATQVENHVRDTLTQVAGVTVHIEPAATVPDD